VTCTVDLGPLVRLHKQVWRGAFFTGLGVYLEAIVAFVLVSQQSLSPAAAVAIVAILIAQLTLARHPVRQLLRGDLVRGYRSYLVLVAGVVLTASFGSPAGDARIVAAAMFVLVAALPVWAALTTIRAALALGPQLAKVRDNSVLSESLSFELSESIAARMRAFGGDRKRWIVVVAAAGLTFVAVLGTLALLVQAMGLRTGAPVGQVAVLAAVFVFYIGMRRAKLSATQLRDRDRRAPVLILRQFGDDFLEAGRVSLGGTPTFEHFVAGELNRIGPVIAIVPSALPATIR
jgi:hypothetical protein